MGLNFLDFHFPLNDDGDDDFNNAYLYDFSYYRVTHLCLLSREIVAHRLSYF